MAAAHDLTIAEAGVALRDGSLSAVALTEAVLARIEATEPALNVYITVTAEIARARAQAAAAQAELRAGPAAGHSLRLQGSVRYGGGAHDGGVDVSGRAGAGGGRGGGGAAARGGGGADGEAGAVELLRVDERRAALRGDPQPLEPRLRAGQQQRWERGGDGGGVMFGVAGDGQWGVGADAGVVERGLRG